MVVGTPRCSESPPTNAASSPPTTFATLTVRPRSSSTCTGTDTSTVSRTASTDSAPFPLGLSTSCCKRRCGPMARRHRVIPMGDPPRDRRGHTLCRARRLHPPAHRWPNRSPACRQPSLLRPCRRSATAHGLGPRGRAHAVAVVSHPAFVGSGAFTEAARVRERHVRCGRHGSGIAGGRPCCGGRVIRQDG